MIALRKPPAKPPNPPRNPTSGRRPSPLKSVCWMDPTTRLPLRCADTLDHTRYRFPPDAPSAAPWQPELICSHRFHERVNVSRLLFRWKRCQSVPSRSRQTGSSCFTDAAGQRSHNPWSPRTQISMGFEGVRWCLADCSDPKAGFRLQRSRLSRSI